MRTTLDIDAPVLRDLKKLQKEEKKTLGRLASELIADGLARQKRRRKASGRLLWRSQRMGAFVDLADKEAVSRALGAPAAGRYAASES